MPAPRKVRSERIKVSSKPSELARGYIYQRLFVLLGEARSIEDA